MKLLQLVLEKVIDFLLKKFIENNKSILTSQQRFRSEKHDIFIKEVNKIALSANNDKRI